MKNTLITFHHFLSFCLVIFISACNPKQSALDKLLSFTENLEQNSVSFTSEQWEQSLATYDGIIKDIATYDTEYSAEEKEKIGRLQGRCQVIFMKHAVEDGLGGFMNELLRYKGLFEGVLEGLNGFINNIQ